jgi:hypothetical protein
LKVLGVDEEIRKKIQQNESTQTSFAELIVEMVKRKKEKQPRCLKKFSTFFLNSYLLYDDFIGRILKFASEKKFSMEMKKIIQRCISMSKSLYDLNIIHNDSVYQNIFIEKKVDDEIQCRFIDFDISSSFDSTSNTLYLPKNLYFEGKRRSKIGEEEIQQHFDYFHNKRSETLDDVEYLIPAYEGEQVDNENMIVYLLSTKSDQQYYDHLLKVLHDKKLTHEKKWKEILRKY